MVKNYNIEEVYNKYYSLVNMSYGEFLEWSKTPCSKKASLSREPIRRNLYILSLNKNEWNNSVCKKALKTISYLSRATKIKSSKLVSGCNYTKNQIALKNWAYDINK